MKCVLNLSISNKKKRKKYSIYAVLERKYLNLLPGINPYYVSIDLNDNNNMKK